ncbi:translocator protein, LysE family [Hallella bergensis DSM 17361]|uniref:Translocator protein, LysE family n=2 Tax=Hallella bergensis TaxID=242750 RepID=D1PUQ2_9BACT|nr:translocator protein, LysE family [Hallella bergensis DSM 17361]
MQVTKVFCNFASNIMPFPIQIDIMELILKGMLIGIIASAPMGPVGVLCIRRTLNKGRWYGFVTGVGASVSDIIYAMITGLGMSFVMDLITNPTNKFWLQISGSVVLLVFGLYCWKSKPKSNIHPSSKNGKGSLIHNGITAFLVTFSNPLIIFLFMASFAQFAFVIPNHPVEMTLGYASIVAGALVWWYGLTWLVDKVHNKFDENGIQMINKIIGSVVILFSLVVLIGTVFNLYTIQY